MRIELRTLNDQLVVVIPQEFTTSLSWGPGDYVDIEIVGNELRLVHAETLHSRAMKISRKGMEKYRNTLEKLAKS